MLEDAKACIAAYQYLVSWKDPFLTGFSFLFFLQFTVTMNPAYIGSVPVFLSITIMLFLAFRRATGRLKGSFTEREIDRKKKVCRLRTVFLVSPVIGRRRMKPSATISIVQLVKSAFV